LNHFFEEYLRFADKVTQSNSYNYDVNRIAKRIEQIPDIGPKFAQAVRTFGFLLFPDEKWGEKLLDDPVSFPRTFKTWSSFYPMKAVSEFIAAQVAFSRDFEKDLDDDERKEIKGVLEKVKKHYQEYHQSAGLHAERTRARAAVKEKNEELQQLTKESNERAEALNQALIEKQKDLSEVNDAIIKYKTLDEILKEIHKQRQSHVNDVQAALGKTRSADEEAIKTLKKQVDDAICARHEAETAAELSPVPEDNIVTTDMLPSLIEALQIFAENETLLILCYEDYMSYFEGNLSRDLPHEPRSWFSFW
jgi:hypothetical protein